MTQLAVDDFPAFFAAANGGREPFPWQTRLARDAAARIGRGEPAFLPDLLDVPTGAGKTSIIDVVTFLQALEAARPPAQRVVPRRTVFVVDRRVVVDQVDEHVRRLGARLRSGLDEAGPLGDVARALKSLHGSDREPPLKVGTLRGGIERDETWARRPDAAVVLTSTVDQIGSRLLFRGYGVSDSVKPIQAGLLGADTLFVLDEVHLAMPFAETLRMLGERYVAVGGSGDSSRWGVVELSATAQPRATRRVFTLGSDDRDPDVAPLLASRLAATKPARLVELVAGVNDDAKFSKAVVSQVRKVMEGGDHRRVLVVCNRVSRAVACAQALTHVAQGRQSGELRGGRIELLTGRMRAVERDAVLARVSPVVAAGSPPPDAPLVLVSTQSIEVGADFDFDALITECASLDALRQRFGRVDRLGTCAQRGIAARGVVIARSAEAKPDFRDPIYGSALGATWRGLGAHAGEDESTGEPFVDFGSGFPAELADDATLLPDRGTAPFIFPQHLDAWSQTSPIPDPDPDAALWLHGLEPSDPDVSVVWRADITKGRLAQAGTDAASLAAVVDAVAAIPPGPSETISLPVSHVRAWLRNERVAATMGDADNPALPVDDDTVGPARDVLVWRGESSAVVQPNRIRPGDIVIVPAEYGGIGTMGSWDPHATHPVADVAEVDQVGPLRRRPVLRINEPVLGVPVPRVVDDESSADTRQRIREFLAGLPDAAVAHDWPYARIATVDYVRQPSARFTVSRDDLGWIVASVARVAPAAGGGEVTSFVAASSEGSSFAAVQVSLDDHTSGTAELVRTFARNCGLPTDLVDDLALAAALHDTGKLDPRFQSMLAYPDPAPAEPLGKSRHGNDRRLRDKARAMSGLPAGFDHAVAGMAILDAYPDLLDGAHDADLVRHLIEAHHGQCRPFARPVRDARAVSVRVQWRGVAIDLSPAEGEQIFDPEVAERFFDLRRRYGWYGLAYVEAILRLADWYQSEQEQLAGGV